MNYNEALKRWGLLRLERAGYQTIVPESVSVEMDFSEGYACCGGSNPNCYCSFAESPRAEVVITGVTKVDYPARVTIPLDQFDFATVLAEIVEAADGMVTNLW